MRKGPAIAIVLLAVVVVLGVTEYSFDWPFALSQGQYAAGSGGPRVGSTTDAAHYSNVRGLQDAPRDDASLGTVLNMSHCLNTMNLRGLTPTDAHHTCEQLIAGISKLY